MGMASGSLNKGSYTGLKTEGGIKYIIVGNLQATRIRGLK